LNKPWVNDTKHSAQSDREIKAVYRIRNQVLCLILKGNSWKQKPCPDGRYEEGEKSMMEMRLQDTEPQEH